MRKTDLPVGGGLTSRGSTGAPVPHGPSLSSDSLDRSTHRPIHTHIVETARLVGPIAAGQLSNQATVMVTLMLLGCDEYVRQSATRKSFGFEHTVLTPTFATSHRGVKTALKGRGQA